jgi:hypothetical protein
MITLELKFENEAAKESVASFLTSGTFSVPEVDPSNKSLTPNHIERSGDAVFFTTQEEGNTDTEGVEATPVGATNLAIGGDAEKTEGAVPAGTGNFESVPAGSTVVDSSALSGPEVPFTGHDPAPQDGSPDGGYTSVGLDTEAGEDKSKDTLADAYTDNGGTEIAPVAKSGETAATGIAPEDEPSRPTVSDSFDLGGHKRQTPKEHLEDIRGDIDREISELDEEDSEESK